MGVDEWPEVTQKEFKSDPKKPVWDNANIRRVQHAKHLQKVVWAQSGLSRWTQLWWKLNGIGDIALSYDPRDPEQVAAANARIKKNWLDNIKLIIQVVVIIGGFLLLTKYCS